MFNPVYKIFWSLGKGSLCGVVWLAAITIDETSTTTIGSAVAVGVLVVYLAKWMQKVSDRLENLEKKLDAVEQRRAMDHEQNQRAIRREED